MHPIVDAGVQVCKYTGPPSRAQQRGAGCGRASARRGLHGGPGSAGPHITPPTGSTRCWNSLPGCALVFQGVPRDGRGG